MDGIEVVASWLTPTVLFCVLNLIIGTIFVISSLKPRNKPPTASYNDAVSPPQLVRAPSFLERVNSIKLSFYRSENPDPIPASTVFDDVPNQDQAHQKPKGNDFHVTRSKSDTGANAPEPAPVMRKSASEKKVPVAEEEVDARADDFINRFRQQLKLQRLESLLKRGGS